jgi:hypothetical protein
MTGTSPAAALVAGSVLTELSINGSLTPAQVEAALKASAEAAASGPPKHRSTSAAGIAIANPDGPIIPPTSPAPLGSLAATPQPQQLASNPVQGTQAPPDADGDGKPDMIEIFHKGDISGTPPASLVSITAAKEMRFKFPIAFNLLTSAQTPFSLGNGYQWAIRCSSNMKDWEIPVGSLEKTTDASGQVWLTATFPADQQACFVRIGIQSADP